MTNQPEFNTQEALEIALDILTERAADTDTASPEGYRVRGAIDTIRALIDQKGCAHFDKAIVDDRLTTLCDMVMFG